MKIARSVLTASAAYAWVYHRYMDSSFGEVGGRCHERKGSTTDIALSDGMSDIDQTGFRRDAEDDTLHGTDKPVLRAEISGQGDGAHNGILFAECKIETNIVYKLWQKQNAK